VALNGLASNVRFPPIADVKPGCDTVGLMLKILLALLVTLLLPVASSAQQHADPKYAPQMARPAYGGAGPIVVVDDSHDNFHTLEGKYAPFGELLAADGYRPRSATQHFSALSLQEVDILVIANARSSAPGLSAFGQEEITAIGNWVKKGGSLLLISDHAPFGTAASRLAEAFGVNMGVGFVVARTGGRISSQILFRKEDLGEHPILDGRNQSERVHSVESFTGQSLSVPPGAVALLGLPRDALEVETSVDAGELIRGGRVLARSVAGRAQAVAFMFGKGRVVMAGDAAMFTEQVIPGLGRVGLRDHDNQQFALNVIHWLSRLIG